MIHLFSMMKTRGSYDDHHLVRSPRLRIDDVPHARRVRRVRGLRARARGGLGRERRVFRGIVVLPTRAALPRGVHRERDGGQTGNERERLIVPFHVLRRYGTIELG